MTSLHPKGSFDSDIFNAARKMFGRLGIEDLDGSDRHPVGPAKRTLYARYPDKISLFKDVVTSVIEHAKTPEPPIFADLKSCLLFHTENFFVIASDPAMRVIRSLGEIEVQNMPDLLLIGQQLTRDVGIVPIAKTITESAQKSGLRVPDPEFIAFSILDLRKGHYTRVQMLKLRNDFASFKFAAERIVNLLMSGIEVENR